MYRYLIILSICAALGLQSWRTLFNNFAVQVAEMDGEHIGVIQSVREIPGFLAFAAVYVLLILKEHRLAAVSILVLGVGNCVTGFFPSFLGLAVTTLIMSFGFHYFETAKQSLTLQHFDQNKSPWVFGKQRSWGALANIAVGVLIFFLEPYFNFQGLYLLFGGFIIVVAMWALFQNPSTGNAIPQRKKMVLKRQYGLFYFLTFMSGARRQIFVAFAIFLMVKKFDFTLREISVLFVVNNVINVFLSPMIGKGIIRFGERKMLSLEYFSLIFVFLGYTVVQSKGWAAILYILDHIFFNFSMAIRTYFQKVGDPKDIAPTMAMGFTINHIAAVFLPAVGGLLWMADYRIPFVCGAGLSLISLIAVQKISIKKAGETE